MQPRFMPDLENPADSLFAAGVEIDANVFPLTWNDAGTALAETPLETPPTTALSNQDVAFAGGQNNLDDDVAVPLPERSALTHEALDAAAPEDGGGPVPMAILPAPTTSMPVVPASAVLANPLAGSAGLHVADVAVGDGGAFGALAHVDYPIFHAGLTEAAPLNSGGFTTVAADPATSAPAQVALAAPANPAHETSGAITEASVGAGGATAAQVRQALDESGLNVNGAGIKIGVLSDSFNDHGGAAADEADGALPSASKVQVLEDLASGGTDEGRAMMQVIHDIAPGASLAFYTAFESEQDFANGILALAATGCKVICDDVSYFDEPFFQNGVVAQAIQTVEAEGVTYVTAAGNNASNGYQAAWTPISGSVDGWSLTNAESFGGSVVQTVTINTEGTNDTVPLILQWNQPYGATTSDLGIFVFRNGSLYELVSNQSVGQEPNNPLVDLQLPSGTYQIAIENLSGPNPTLIKEITAGDGFPATIGGANAGTVVGHAMTPGAIAAGAVSAADTPAFGFNPASEFFSSSGAGAELLFADNGTALSSPDVLNPVVVSGIDDVATTVSGSLADFYGTSAASASLAGVAALLLSANPALTPAQVEQIMEETALPMSNSAVSGAGLVQVGPAVAAAEALIRIAIESHGSTSLRQVGENYFLDSISSGTGPELKYGGAPVTAGEFSTVVPIGAEQTASGYDVAWKVTATGQYTAWETDSNGNFIANITGVVAGNSIVLESLENTFQQDLNGDGTTGLVGRAIESHGSTSLLQVGNNYDLESISSGTGPELQRGGAAVTVGEGGSWKPIAAERVAGGGYDVAWENPSTGQYSVWSTNSNGNSLSNLITQVAGNSAALESLEITFQQDLNGDGKIGLVGKAIESYGSTSLLQVGNTYDLESIGSGTGPELQRGGAAVTVGGGGSWKPIGAEQVAGGGYDVAWENPSTGQYSVWSTDSNGNYLSNLITQVAGNSAALESLENTFDQDLNGDRTIGVPATPVGHVAARSISAMMGGSGNDNFLFHTDSGAAPAVTVADKFEPHEFSSAGDTNITALLNEAHDHWRTVQSASGGPDLAGDHHDAEAARVHPTDLQASHFIIH
jgi:hypothetical protein